MCDDQKRDRDDRKNTKNQDTLEKSLREYQERKRQEFELNIPGLDDIGNDTSNIFSLDSVLQTELEQAENIESHSGQKILTESKEKQNQHLPLPKGQKKQMKKRARRNKRVFFWTWVAMILLVSFSIAQFFRINFNDMVAVGRESGKVQVQIPRNATGAQVGQILYENGVINKPNFFTLYSKVTKSDNFYQYGIYEVEQNMDYEALINHMQSNLNRLDNETTRIAITEGMSVLQIAQLLEDHGICTVDEILTTANNAEYFDIYAVIKEITNDKERYYLLEGYLFPDSYDFYTGENPIDALSKMLNNYKAKITQEMRDKAASMNLTMDQVMTLASMIQAEAADVNDMYMISSVFHNRLNHVEETGIKTLDSDPTVWYPYHTKEDVPADQAEKFVSRYNTYQLEGIPPGPICNPGMDAIQAALNPRTTDYYYFCHKEGQAYYSKTLEEHNQKLLELGLV